MLDQANASVSTSPLMDIAWTILEAANDLGDTAAVEACRRVIDAALRGGKPEQSDTDVIFAFFE